MQQVTRLSKVVILAGCLSVLLAGLACAANVTYDTDNRPILFEGIELNATMYNVAVTWNSNYLTVYSSQDPLFLGDEAEALAALSALSHALVGDGFTSTQLVSYLDVPFEDTGSVVRGWSLYLRSGPTYQQYVEVYYENYYETVGYTVWTEIGPVNSEAATWSQVKAVFR